VHDSDTTSNANHEAPRHLNIAALERQVKHDVLAVKGVVPPEDGMWSRIRHGSRPKARVWLNRKGQVRADLRVNARYGPNLQNLANTIQEVVGATLLRSTGAPMGEVNVFIDAITLVNRQPDNEAKGNAP
jgi:uncharacterized alkaline shock family protein YloU